MKGAQFKVLYKITPAEATMAWFYSGKKQSLINYELRIKTKYAPHDCTKELQMAIDQASDTVFIPTGAYGCPVN